MHLLQWPRYCLNDKLVNADVLDDPIPNLLGALQSHANASQLLHLLEEEVVCRSQI